MIRKILLLLIFQFSVVVFSFGQSWYPVGRGITGDWGVLAEAVYNGQLYVGGWFYEAGTVTANNMARLDGHGWDSVGSGLTGGQNYVAALCVYNGKLYACGSFFAADGLATNNIAVWDGSHWDTVSTKGLQYCGGGTGWADAMAVYNGKLYVAGAFCHAGGITAENIACWDGSKWDSVSSGINDSVNALAVYNGKLYAAGQFSRAGKVAANNIACWDGTSWSAVSSGTNNVIYALQVYNSALYAGGGFSAAGGKTAHFIASWNGTTWDTVAAGITGNVGVEAFCVFNGLLYVGGNFNKSRGLVINNVASWNGIAWDTVSTQGINYTVDAFAVYDSALFAGGLFTMAGTANASFIAMWTSTPLGINTITDNPGEVKVYPNPNKGRFNIACYPAISAGAQYKLDIYDMLGSTVLSETLRFTQGDNAVDLSSQPSGVYLYRLTNKSGSLINQGKIVIQ